MKWPSPFAGLAGPQRLQVQAGVVCGLLAMAIYAARPSEAAPVELVKVVAVGKAVPLGRRLTSNLLVSAEVPAAVAADYLPDSPEVRAKLDGRTAHLRLEANDRLSPAMFLGGLDDDLAHRVPAGHRSEAVRVQDVPAGLAPGVHVDLLGPRGVVAHDVTVLALDPFTVAVPNKAALAVTGRQPLTVAVRPADDADLADPVRERPPRPPKTDTVILPTPRR